MALKTSFLPYLTHKYVSISPFSGFHYSLRRACSLKGMQIWMLIMFSYIQQRQFTIVTFLIITCQKPDQFIINSNHQRFSSVSRRLKKNEKKRNKISIDCGISLRQDTISSCSPPFLEKRAWHLSGIMKGRFSDLQKLMTDNEKGFQCSRWQGYKSEPLSSQLRWLSLHLKLLFRSHFWLVPNSKSVPSQTNSQK